MILFSTQAGSWIVERTVGSAAYLVNTRMGRVWLDTAADEGDRGV
jgi:hypothetical protein